MSEVFEELQWKKFKALNDGVVCLVDVMGTDASIVEAARVSYGEGTKHTSDDRTLIRYLMRMKHSTPLEMCEIKLLVRVPMDCWRQWIRHRTQNVNEYSTRYSEAIDSQQKTKPDKWRAQSKSNKQGSSNWVEDWPEDWEFKENAVYQEGAFKVSDRRDISSPGKLLCVEEDDLHKKARQVYQRRLDLGVAREQARKDLPLSTYTEAYVKNDLHNWLHFLGLRMDSHAQQEIREYATIIGEQIVKPLFPLVWEAFEDYRLGGMFLTRLDKNAIWTLVDSTKDHPIKRGLGISLIKMSNKGWDKIKCRERDECIGKLERLNLIEREEERLING